MTPKRPIPGFDFGADVDAADTAQQEIGDAQAEPVALKRAGLMLVEFDAARWVGRGQSRVRTTETALARPYGPGRRRLMRAVREADRAAMT